MCRLALKFDPKLVFLLQNTLFEKILPTMVIFYLDLHVQPQLDVTPTITITFDLWMSRG
jgi:hypothetical protein